MISEKEIAKLEKNYKRQKKHLKRLNGSLNEVHKTLRPLIARQNELQTEQMATEQSIEKSIKELHLVDIPLSLAELLKVKCRLYKLLSRLCPRARSLGNQVDRDAERKAG